MKCNKCKSSNVQRYQVIYEQGTSNIDLGSNTVGGGVGFGGGLRGGVGLGRTGTSGKSQTIIAEKTKPPKGSYILSGLIGAVIGIIPLLVPTGFGWWALVVCLAIGMVPCIKTFQSEEKILKEKLDIWIRTWYCNKCGNSFLGK